VNKRPLVSKYLAVGITLLFIGTSIIPTITCAKSENIFVEKKAICLTGKTTSLNSLSSPAWAWAKGAGGTYPDIGCDIAVDIFGNTYVMGWYVGSVTFGDITLTSWSSQVFVAKLSPSGVWLWATSTTGEGNPQEYGGIAVDIYMNVYITGIFSQTMTFGNTTIDGYQGNVFIAKLDRNGNWRWAVSAGREESSYGWAIGMGIAVDFLGNAYITGWFFGKITFGKTTLNNLDTQGILGSGEELFIAKVNSRGVWRWATSTTNSSSEDSWGFSIAVDFGRNVYVTGFFDGDLSFNTINLISHGADDVFVAKLNPRGACQWAKSAGGVEYDQGAGIAVDRARNIYITGVFSGSATFGNTTLTTPLYTMFVAKLDRNGAWQWAKGTGDVGVAIGLSIAMDVSRNAYITGWFQGTSTFGDTTLTCSGDADVFVSKLNTDGSWLWATHAGGSDLTGGRGIAVGIGGNVFVTGSFRGTAMFGNTTLTSCGEEDVFVAKLR
jgi:hypothetical protein